jgi:hypothetical protein
MPPMTDRKLGEVGITTPPESREAMTEVLPLIRGRYPRVSNDSLGPPRRRNHP